MARCPRCNGNGKIICLVCKGRKYDPQDPSIPCRYCGGSGHHGCSECCGTGLKEE